MSNKQDLQLLFSKHFAEASALKHAIAGNTEILTQLNRVAWLCVDALSSGGKLLFCGNGGSASDSQHLATECLVRLRSEVNRSPIPAIALTLDTGAITAHGNDFGFEGYFARMIRALGQKGDVLFALTTSGRSPNLIHACAAAREVGVTSVGLLGNGGGALKKECDISIVVPSSKTMRIQEATMTLGHALIEIVEDLLMERGVVKKE